jgi:hypothetical protein
MATSSKWARVLCQNEITEIVMDSESDEENYACEGMDEEQAGPSSRRSSITRPAVVHGSGRKSSFSTCWTWPLSTVTPFYLHMVWGKSRTEIFDSRLSERCWHGPGTSHDYPCPYGDHPQLLLTSEDRTHVTISIGLATTAWDGDVACVQQGAWRERWCSNVSSVMWRFVWTKTVLWITTHRTTYKTSFRPSSVQRVEASTTM